MVIGMVEAATSATRNGNSSITTITTATMAITSSRKNELTLSPTTCAWSVMRYMLTSEGSSFLNSSSTWLMSSPICTMFLPFFISTLSKMHFVPLFLM